jgi:hypothetical protein
VIMGTGYAKAPEVVASYAKLTPSASDRRDIRDIVHPPYRDAAVVLGVLWCC